MRRLLAGIVERDLTTGLLVASVPGVPGAHSQGETVEEARDNLQEVLGGLLEGGSIHHESEFVANISVRIP